MHLSRILPVYSRQSSTHRHIIWEQSVKWFPGQDSRRSIGYRFIAVYVTFEHRQTPTISIVFLSIYQGHNRSISRQQLPISFMDRWIYDGIYVTLYHTCSHCLFRLLQKHPFSARSSPNRTQARNLPPNHPQRKHRGARVHSEAVSANRWSLVRSTQVKKEPKK